MGKIGIDKEDSYALVLDKLGASVEDLFDAGMECIIKPNCNDIWETWNKLKGRKQSLYVRGSGRNGSNSYKLIKFYRDILQLDVEIDPTNNQWPQKTVEQTILVMR